MKIKNNHVIVVGGGAAGILASISAKRQGAQVTLLERNPRIGKKILVTGNGRCNFTNVNADIDCYSGENPKFAYSALANFDVKQTIMFFEELGIAHKVEDMGKVFPMSDQASSVLDVLRYELEEIGVNVICNAFVKEIDKEDGFFKISLENGQVLNGDKAIITVGGKAMPSTGSDGNGYELAGRLGHNITKVYPALVQLRLEGSYFKQIQGVKFVGTAEIIDNNKTIAKDRGDILFANYGISGPPILQISRKAGKLLNKGKKAILKVAIIDSMSKDELTEMLMIRFNNRPSREIKFSLVGLINKRLIPVVLKEAGIKDLSFPVGNLTKGEAERIASILTDWRFQIKGTRSWPSAQVTAGGIRTNEINQSTMESRIVEGLYFAGEVIDIDGKCGGFNLQWAWSSGFTAGLNAALNK
ncbi:MAG TPA: NAD(P)/FAD-dependent oxidoreductase [Thermoanaerobacterales bacterium]|nr:NAD(P)/FAD-dependent oxidoreductase [Thermoanaerobacterales bacterium]